MWVLLVTCISYGQYCGFDQNPPTTYGSFMSEKECDQMLLKIAKEMIVPTNGAYTFRCVIASR